MLNLKDFNTEQTKKKKTSITLHVLSVLPYSLTLDCTCVNMHALGLIHLMCVFM